MYTRHEEVPQYDSQDSKIDAMYYNHVQTALKRLGQQIRLEIPKLKHLDLILQKDAWIIVDVLLNDLPVAAWSDFQTEGRGSLHKPVPCKIRFYHYAARMVLNRTLEAMELVLGEQLSELSVDAEPKVLPFRKD